jgi:hypothetical protein
MRDGPLTFQAQNWGDVILVTFFLAGGGCVALTESNPALVLLGVGLLLCLLFVLLAYIGSRKVAVTAGGVTVRRFFRWSKTYKLKDLTGATGDWRWLFYPRSMPQLNLKDGKTVMLWSMTESTWTKHPTTDAIVTAVNEQAAFRPDRTSP